MTAQNLEEAVADAADAKNDDAYAKAAKNVKTAAKAYQNSVKQRKQVTNPKESFLIERAKTVNTVTNVEAVRTSGALSATQQKELGKKIIDALVRLEN